MQDLTGRGRRGRAMFWLGVAVLAAFAGLSLAVRLVASRNRYLSDAALLEELQGATLLDDPAPPADAWPGWLGPRRDGSATLAGLQPWSARGPRRLWRVPGGEGYASFAAAGGSAFTTLGRDEGEVIGCFDLATGQERWSRPHTLRARAEGYPGPRATPTFDADRLWTMTSDGVVHCLSQSDGGIVWQCDLRETVGAPMPRWGFASSPLLHGGRIHVVAGGRRCLVALDRDSGAVAWTSASDPAGYSSPVAATIAGVPQIVAFTGRRLIGVAAADGEPLWEFDWPTSFEVNAATPLVIQAKTGGAAATYVFVSSGYHQGCALLKIEPRGAGRFLARPVYTSNELCCHFATPLRRGDHVYGLDETRDLTCLDLRSGRVAWRFDKPEDDEEEGGLRRLGFKKGALIRIADRLLVLGEEGKLALVEATPEAYRELAATRPFRDRCWALPVLIDGRLLLRDRRTVQCFDLRPAAPVE